MSDGQNIINKIIADAKADAEIIIDTAKKEANGVIASAKERAERENASYMNLAQAEADKARAKEISGADMAAKKMILSKKQELLEDVIKEAEKKLLNLKPKEYAEVVSMMLDSTDKGKDVEVILSEKDKAVLSSVVAAKGFKVSDESRDITGGFVVKKGDIEYNYSFESIIAVEHEDIEQIVAEILFG